MKQTKKLNHALLLAIILFLIGCSKSLEPLCVYEGWRVIEKKKVYFNGNAVEMKYPIVIQKGTDVKKIYTYSYYYNNYSEGDLIEACE